MSEQKSETRNRMLLQTIVPLTLARWVRAQAKRESISVAAWIRRLLMQTRETYETVGMEDRG